MSRRSTITCTRCKRTLPREEFRPRSKGKVTSWCAQCLDAPPSATKVCNKCGETKDLAAFHRRSSRPSGVTSQCIDCRRAYMAAWRAEHPERAADRRPVEERRIANRKTRLRADYGLTWEQFEGMVEQQDGLCAICRQREVQAIIVPRHSGVPRTVVDHDHVTGEVRGLLCVPCNLLIGYAEDDVAVLGRAIDYLKGHKGEG